MWAAQISTASFAARHVDIVLDLADALAESGIARPRVLSFGCSKGFEPLDLAHAIPGAEVLGCDVCPDALAEAVERTAPAGIRIFASTPADIAAHGPYDAVVALNVLTRYPAIRGRDDISPVYPFADFDFSATRLADSLNPGGILAVYNACYLFEQTAAAAAFRPVPARRHARNGWMEKHDRSGTRLTTVVGEFEGR
ncbi:MAG TPA: class I SAM-dependent methyltransferase, partial [Micromonosporaceae bacterium]|nr:class I SAM-dependent methyltransferase [Micromonosporaceae bacterium]